MFQRMRQGWDLTKKAWGVVRREPKLLKLPIIGGAIALLIAVVIGGPGLWIAASDDSDAVVVGYALIAVAAYLASFVVIYYNVMLAAAANDALLGREPDLGSAKHIARSRIPAIAGWALISVIVSLLVNALRNRAGTAGNILGAVGAAAWGFVTFLVVPVLALEGIGPVAAVKRSGTLVKNRWGQQVTGNVVIGGFAALATIAGAIVAVLGGVLLFTGTAGAIIGAVLIIVGVLAAIAGSVVAGATRGVFGVALYHFSADHRAVGPFTDHELAGAAS
jgi:Family of unknown function (DUF6159)